MGLVTLAYISYATKEMTENDLKALLAKSRANNAKTNITGMLLYRDKVFLQVLEGESETVDALMKIVIADPRHRNLMVVYRTGIAQRAFAEWQMGFNYANDETMSFVQGYSDFLANPTTQAQQQPNMAQRLLEAFRTRSTF
jgi:hypothetical protein